MKSSSDFFTLELKDFVKNGIEQTSRVFDLVQGKCVLEFKLLACAFFYEKSTIPIDISLHWVKGEKTDFGLTAKQHKYRYTKKRKEENPDSIIFIELTESKLQLAVEMLKRAGAYKSLHAKYELCDNWFTCEYFICGVLKLGKGALHLVGLAKMGNAKYSVYSKLHNTLELSALYEGNSQYCHNCRHYKCHYIAFKSKLGEQSVHIFLIRYGRNQSWNILLSTKLACLSSRPLKFTRLDGT